MEIERNYLIYSSVYRMELEGVRIQETYNSGWLDSGRADSSNTRGEIKGKKNEQWG